MLFHFSEVMAKPAVLKVYDSDFEILIPSNLKLERNTPKSKEVAQKIKSFYFGDQPVSQETLLQYVNVSKEKPRDILQ
jgi:hypothetical protein